MELTSSEILDKIFKDPNAKYGLNEFEGIDLEKIIKIYPKEVESGIAKGEIRYYLKCLKRNKDIQVHSQKKSNPEEIIRQLYIYKLVHHYSYPLDRIDVEKEIYFGSGISEKPADIIVYQTDGQTAQIIVEVKKPNREDGIEQLKSYLNAEGSPIGVWVNGIERVILYRPYPREFEETLTDIPRVDQTIDELLDTKVTWDHLKEEFDFKRIILQLEELVLANSGEDEFQEIFKLIFAKLYDENEARNRLSQEVYFRKLKDPRQTYERINTLFKKSIDEWPGIFDRHDIIRLSPAHLSVCIPQIESLKLFGSNMRVMDDAFEYLMTKVSKGSKGQYFTPRYVIDMCIKMLNPGKKEYVIDPACGSGGFLIHTMDYIQRKHYTRTNPRDFIQNYAGKYLFGIDFDNRAAKIAKALMLIAGDGRTHIFKLNALNPKEWLGNEAEKERARSELREHLYEFEDYVIDNENKKNFKYFNFDILLTNPPFAGEIKEKGLLRNYELAKPALKRKSPMVERDVLFLERCLQFLRPGGRMAIVLPQGKFNNSTLEYIRKWVLEKSQILAVVGLNENTFKPHTGTKTSILFLKKLAEGEALPEDYPIFMATSQKSGKDNSGEYTFLKNEGGNFIEDEWGNKLIDHDLDEISNAFIEFAKESRFDFWRE